MKKILSTAMLAAGLLFSGCSDRLYNSDSKLSTERFNLYVYPTYVDYTRTGGSKSISVDAEGGWQIGAVPEWVSYTKTNNSVELKAEVNPTTAVRTGIANIITGDKDITITQPVSLTQAAGERGAYFNEYITYEVSPEAQVLSVPYTSNVPKSEVKVKLVDYTYYWPSWIEAVVNDNTIDFKISANENYYPRTENKFILTPTPTGYHPSINIRQLGVDAKIEGETKSLTVPWTGGNYTVNFISTGSWSCYTLSDAWLSVIPENGDKANGDVVASVSENLNGFDRTGILRFKVGNENICNFEIKQEGLNFSAIEPSSVTLDQTGDDSKTVTFTTNMPWEVYETPGWLTVTPEAGEAGTHTVTLKANGANGSTKPRTHNLRFRAQNNTSYYSEKLAVTQAGIPNGVGENDLYYGWPGGTQNVDIFTPGTWQCAVSDPWISVSQTSGLGNGNLGITVQPNSQATERSGSVLVQLIDETLTINVRQQGQYFYIDNSSSQLNAMGGNIELTVFTSVGASAQVEPQEATEWLTFTGPNDESTFVITAAYNPSINARNANFVLTPTMDEAKAEYTQGLVYNIIQAGRKLETSVPKLYLVRQGGVSEPCTIIAEGGYRIWKDEQDSWYILQANDNNSSFTISATPNNTGANRTGVVHIELTGLPDGESKQVDVQIIQTTDMFDVELGEFGEDEQW